MSASVVERARSAVDAPTATVLVSTDAEAKQFIAEAFVVGATIFLLQRYAAGFLKGVGFDDAATRHGEKARSFLQKLRGGRISDADLDSARAEAEAAVSDVRASPDEESGRSAAEQAVVDELVEAGAIRAAAEDVARGLTDAVFST